MDLSEVAQILEAEESEEDPQSAVMLMWAVNACRTKIAARDELPRARALLGRLMVLPRVQMAVDRFDSNPPPKAG